MDLGLVILGGRKERRRVRGSWVGSRGGFLTTCPGKEVRVSYLATSASRQPTISYKSFGRPRHPHPNTANFYSTLNVLRHADCAQFRLVTFFSNVDFTQADFFSRMIFV